MESGSSLSLDKLTRLGSRGNVDMRPTLLRVLTDLYVQRLVHSPQEEQHFTELALRLLDSVDVACRVAVAERLARHLAPPVRVMKHLAADLPAVANAVRTHPALRIGPPPSVSETAGRAPDLLAWDERAPESRRQDESPSDHRSRPIADLSVPIASELAAELNELFFAADAEERRLILLNLEIAAPLPATRSQPGRPEGNLQKLESAALTGNRRDFARHLAEALDVPPAQAERIASDQLGEPLVVAAKTLGMPRDVVYRLLLFVNSAVGHSVERVHALATLYDEIPPAAAEHLVAIWRALQPTQRKAAKHQPALWNDEPRGRTPIANAQRVEEQQRSRVRRDVS